MTFDAASHTAPQPIVEPGYVYRRPGPGVAADWLTTEVAALQRLYPTGGASAVQAVLPHRSLTAIRAKAWGLQVKCLKGTTTGLRFARRYPQCDHIDNAVREGYMHLKNKGDVKALAERIGRPAWWVQKRASGMGLARCNRTRTDCWTAPELALLEELAACDVNVIAAKFRKAGFARTATAIGIQLKRRKFDRTDPDRWTATELGPLLGVDPKTVQTWIAVRGLPATREAWGPNGRLMVQRKQLRAWIATHQRYVDLRRVDQTWFMDLVLS